jgi:hypothetical protein
MAFGHEVTIHPLFRRRTGCCKCCASFVACSGVQGALSSPRRVRATWRFSRSRLQDASRADRAFLYFHWIRETPGKLRFFRAICADNRTS